MRSVTSSTTVDIVGAELSIDTFTANLEYNTEFAWEGAILFSPADYDGVVTSDGYWFCADASANGELRDLEPGTIIRQYHDDVLVGKYYLKNVERIGKTVFKVNAISAIGLLDMKRHTGGLYTGATTFAALVAELIGNTIPYSIEAEVATIPIFGWLPIGTARENLHKLMFAEGVSMTKDSDGDIVFSFLYSSATPPSVPSSRIYLGGNIDYSTPATAVEITEHTFYDSGNDEDVTLFDNSSAVDAADHLLVSFSDAPVHDVTATGLTINESGTNYAIVTGRGVLTGKKYTHTTSVVRKETPGATGAENVVSVADDCLVVTQNSENVAKRVLAFYSSKKRVGAGILLQGEKAGRQIAFVDPYGDNSTGFIQSMEITATALLKGDAQIITDYTPTGQGNNYSNYVLLTGSGNWTVPAGIEEVKAILVGGGHGGYAGEAGHYGVGSSGPGSAWGYPDWPHDDGLGGAGGQGGEGGKVQTSVIAVTPGASIAFACGAGGAGGSSGGDTTFGAESSANGSIPANGIINVFTGAIYALGGEIGQQGKSGASMVSPVVTIEYNGATYTSGAQGQTASNGTYYLYGGYGGAPAPAANGGAGNAGMLLYHNGVLFGATGGAGGTGATPTVAGADATTYGSGGQGGHGGAGGGAGGTAYYPQVNNYQGAGGAGGSGGVGGRGADGCIILYY